MRKYLYLLILIFMTALIFNVNGEPSITYDTSNSGVSLVGNTLTIEENTHLVEKDGYGIYATEDLNIILKGDAYIDATNGIKCDGQLHISASEDVDTEVTLHIDYSSIGLECSSKPFTIDGVTLVITNVTPAPSIQPTAYKGKPIINSLYIFDDESNIAYYNPYHQTLNKYEDKDLIEENNPMDTITIQEAKLANLEDINDAISLVYKGTDSYEAKQGFIIAIDSPKSSVQYSPNINTHYVNIWNDFDENNLSYNFIEFLFNKEAWGKVLKYKVLESKNFYKDVEKTNPFVPGETYFTSIIGNDVYTDKDGNYLVSNFILFVADGDDNKIVLQLIGEDVPPTLKYVNLEVKKYKEEERVKESSPSYDYIFVNTCVRSQRELILR